MAFPRRSSRTPRSRYTLGLLLLTAVSLLVLDLPGTGPLDPVRGALAAVFRPFRSAGDTVFEPFANGWKGAFGYDDVKKENDELRAKLDKYENQDAQIGALEDENAELKRLEGIVVGKEEYVAARVTAGQLNSIDRAIEIDKGKGDGIRKGMPVVTDGGVLGRIAQVRGGTATIELLTESSSTIGIRTSKGDPGYVEGQGPGQPLLLTLSIETDYADLAKGDRIVTSGIDRTQFPGDLVIGKVTSIAEGDGSSAPTVEVEVAADPSLVYVKVIKKAPPK